MFGSRVFVCVYAEAVDMHARDVVGSTGTILVGDKGSQDSIRFGGQLSRWSLVLLL